MTKVLSFVALLIFTLTKFTVMQNFDPEAFIDSLECHNKIPRIVNVGSGEARFDKNYDWSEYLRSLQLLKEMPKHTPEIWPSLIHHFNDKRYVSTVATSSGAKLNLTIGDACFELVRDTLTVPFMQSVPRSLNRKVIGAQLRPEFMDSRPSIRRWLETRKDKPVYELQIEMCEWAKKEMQATKAVRINPSEIEEWTNSIDETIRKLNSEKTAISSELFSTFESLYPGAA